MNIETFLHVAKLFVIMDHRIFINNLENTRMMKVVHLIISPLCDKKQRVSNGNTLSKRCVMECGVPQGIVLAPISFIIYLKDNTTR